MAQCHVCSMCVVSVCGECAVGVSTVVYSRLWDRKVWQRVLGRLTGNYLAVTKEHSQLYSK